MSIKPPSLSPSQSLDDVITRVMSMDKLAPQRRKDLASALRKLSGLIGRPPRDIEANVEALSRHMAGLTSAMAGMTASRWQNVRSLVGAALKVSGVKVLRKRRLDSLPPVWRALLDQVPDRYRKTRLCRFASFCAAEGVEPNQVDDAVADRFHLAMKQDSLVERPTQVHRDACLSWNQSAESIPGWPAQRLTVPNRRKDFALAISAYPASFSTDLDAYLRHLAGDDLFSEMARKPCSPTTLKDVRQRVLQLAAALVQAGHAPASITSLTCLVQPTAAKAALSWLWERNGKRKTGQLHHFTALLVKIGKHWSKLDAADLDTLRAIRRQMDPGQTGMTDRNRARLRQFDDPENVRRLVNLPMQVLRSFPGKGPLSHHDAVALQSALAIAILFVAPMRAKNLASLTLDRHVLAVRYGGVRHLVIPAEEVKNKTSLEFELPLLVLRILDVYLERARPVLSSSPSVYLFPAPKGGAKTPGQIAGQIKTFIKRELGLVLNAHAFRHLSAMLFLKQHPGDYATVQLLLGHKSLETTIKAYCGMEQADALRRYDATIEGYRDAP